MIIPTLFLMTVAARPVVQNPEDGKKLVFNQDFSKLKTIDPEVWEFNDSPPANNEIEKYASGPGPNASIEDGALVITARKDEKQVTSARLVSKKSWLYGYFEAEVEVPKGRGTWPAFWMLNDRIRAKGADFIDWPKCGEIDIMENVGFDPGKYHFSMHCQDFNFMKNTQRTSTADASQDGFHKFGCDWTPDQVTFYMDGKVAASFKKGVDTFDAWPFRQPFYIILNLAIGGSWGGSKGVDDSIFPCQYKVKYVKVWQ